MKATISTKEVEKKIIEVVDVVVIELTKEEAMFLLKHVGETSHHQDVQACGEKGADFIARLFTEIWCITDKLTYETTR